MWPRVSRISDERRTASEKSEVRDVSAARKRLPKLWPSSPEPLSKRCRKSLESKASSSLRATMQLRMSPGGSMLNSLRRRPLEPPSSLTVTTAQRSRMTGASGEVDNSVSGVPTNFFSPLSRVERPVPPPIATTRRPRSRADLSDGGHSTVLLCIEETPQGWLRRLVLEVAFRRINFLAGIRIQQLGEAWILDQILEVGIVPRLETQLRIEVEGF